jgi:O-antigen/teichoic acid export membrane protein
MSHRSARESLLSTGLVTLVVSVGGTALNFVANVALARGLGPTEKGSYDLMIATAQLLTLLLGVSLPAGITYVVARRLADPGRLVPYAALTGLVQGVLVGGLLAFMPEGWRSALVPASIGVAAAVPIGIYVAATSIAGYWRAILIGAERIMTMNLRDIGGRFVGAVVVIAMLLSFAAMGRPRAIEMMWAASLAAIVAAAAFFVRVGARGPSTRMMAILPTLIGFALPAFGGNLVQYLNYRLDLFLVAGFRGYRDVGLYAVAVAVAQMVWLISSSAATVLLPRVAAHQTEVGEMGKLTARVARLTLTACLAASVVLAFVGREFVSVVYGSAYEPSADALLLLLPGVVGLAYASILASYIAGSGRPVLNLLVALVALVATVAADLILIPTSGIAGAAIASSLSYLLTALLTMGVFNRLTRVGLGELLVVRPDDLRSIRASLGSMSHAR